MGQAGAFGVELVARQLRRHAAGGRHVEGGAVAAADRDAVELIKSVRFELPVAATGTLRAASVVADPVHRCAPGVVDEFANAAGADCAAARDFTCENEFAGDDATADAEVFDGIRHLDFLTQAAWCRVLGGCHRAALCCPFSQDGRGRIGLQDKIGRRIEKTIPGIFPCKRWPVSPCGS
jgi:hypothetical protein